jgi:stage II sporulation protein D
MSRIFVSFVVLFFLAGRPFEFGRETAFFQEFLIPKPIVRIALGLNPEDVHIHASPGLKVYRAGDNYELLAEGASEVRVKSRTEGLVTINGELVSLDERTSLYFIPPNPQSYLTYSGKYYRGIFILRGGRRGAILVNVLNLEDYLKSVIPGKLSPYYFGEIEALKAQAIAA